MKISRIFLIFLIILSSFFITRAYFPSNSTINIINNKNLYWGKGWENKQSQYSGSEINLRIQNTNEVTFSFETNFADVEQGADIIIDGKHYILSSPYLNDKKLTISFQNPKDIKSIKIKHFCTHIYKPCDLTISKIMVDSRSVVLPHMIRSTKSIAILGDSLAAHHGDKNYIYLLAQQMGYELHNASIFGSKLTGSNDKNSGVSRFQKDILNYKPNILIIALGTNDVYENVSIEHYIETYTQLVKKSKESLPDTKIYTLGIFYRRDISPEIIDQYNNQIETLSRGESIEFINTSSWVDDSDLHDAVHLSEESQSKVAEKLINYLTKKI